MKTFIIAEAGVNHNGNLYLAKKMVDIASEFKVDAIKFQTFKSENLVTKNITKAPYQIKNTKNNNSQYEMLKKLEFSFDDFIILKKYCDKKNILFLSTPFDIESAKFLRDLGLGIFKISSGDITNYLLLKEIGSYNKKVIFSTGMATMDEIKEALELLIKSGTKKENITILHCNTDYPTPFEDVNLNAMLSIKDRFGVDVGYSDHTIGIEVPISAVTLGAKVIEKHFTLDKNLSGPDHKASLEPNELKDMVKAIRNIEISLGDGIKRVTKSEIKNKNIARKVIVAKKDIKKGDVLDENNLTIKRAGIGINPMRWEEIVGSKAIKDFKEDEIITIKGKV